MNSPKEIATNYINIAKAKTSLKWYKSLMLAILAGIFISFGGIASTAVSSEISGGFSTLVKGLVFPVGLILVVVCGAELFTGNCLLISPLVSRDIKLSKTLKSWGIVYLGNLIGSVLIAVLVVYSHVQSETVATACVNVAKAKCNMTFFDAFLRGILCNMLVCLAVWGAMASKTVAGKIMALYMPVLAFVVCGFEHSVANMYFLSSGLMTASEYGFFVSELNVGNAILNCLLPSTLGNIVGGFFIALSYHLVYRFKEKSQPID